MGTIDRLANLSSSNVARYLLKSLTIWTIVLSALALELWLFWTRMPKLLPGSVAWSTFDPAAAMLLLPFIAMFFFFRLPFVSKRLPVNYIVKPMQCLRVPAAVDAQAITATLRRELSRLQAKAREIAIRSPLQTTATLSISHLSIPLDWLWHGFKRLITGSKIVVIEAILFDTEQPCRIVAWVNYPAYLAEHKIEGEQSSALEQALLNAALGLIERLEPALGAAIEWDFQNYDGAVNLMLEQPPSFARDLDLARLLVACNRDELAREKLLSMREEHFMFSARRTEVSVQRATIDIKVGEYASARTRLDRLMRRRRWPTSQRRRDELRRLWTLLGGCNRDDGRFEEALHAYREVESQMVDELRRMLNLPADSKLDACLRRSLVRPSARVSELLGEMDVLYESIASCSRLQHQDALTEYQRQLSVLDVRRQLNASDAEIVARIAHVSRYAGSASPPPRASEYFAQALESYEAAINLLRRAEFFDRNFRVRTELAWCEFGKLLCCRALLTLEQSPDLTEEIEESLRMVFRLGQLLPSEDGESFERVFYLASGDPSGEHPAHVDALGRAAALLMRALFAANPRLMLDLAEGLKRLNPSSSLSIDQERMKGIFERLGALSQLSIDEFADCHGLFNTTLRLLDVISCEKDSAALQSFWTKLKKEDDLNSSLRECQERFAALTRSGHHDAEYFYGMACLTAILCDAGDEEAWIPDVALNLGHAIAHSSGEKTRSGYIGRARIDPDFDRIRENPSIRHLLNLDRGQPARTQPDSEALRAA